MEIELPIFGKVILDKNNWKDWDYRFETRLRKYNFNGLPIDLDVHFKKVDNQKILKVSSALNELGKIHEIGATAIQKDYQKGQVVKDYLKEWEEDIFLQIFDDEKDFQTFIKDTDKEKNIEERLLSLIRIVRIGIYTESENSYVTMDFAFGYDHKDEFGFREDMLVVTLNTKLKVTDICTEG